MRLDCDTTNHARAPRRGIVRFLRSREELLSATLLVHIAAFLVLPALHLVDHRPDHTHGPDGVSHSHPRPVKGGAPTPAPGHDGHGSALHFGLALPSTPTFVFVAIVALAVAAMLPFPSTRPAARPSTDSSSPRGPPLAA
jgi:hypothetical protein